MIKTLYFIPVKKEIYRSTIYEQQKSTEMSSSHNLYQIVLAKSIIFI